MSDLNEQLRQYELAGKALQEMLDEHTEMSEVKKEEIKENHQKTLGKVALKILGESLINEMGPMYGGDRNPYEGCPKRVLKLQKLIRLVDRLLNDYKELYFKPYHESEEEFEVADELKDMMASSIKIVLGSAIGKMQAVWNEKEQEEPRQTSGDPTNGLEIEIVPQEEIRSPAGDIYIVKEQIDDKIKLIKKSTNEQYHVNVDTFKKWKSS